MITKLGSPAIILMCLAGCTTSPEQPRLSYTWHAPRSVFTSRLPIPHANSFCIGAGPRVAAQRGGLDDVLRQYIANKIQAKLERAGLRTVDSAHADLTVTYVCKTVDDVFHGGYRHDLSIFIWRNKDPTNSVADIVWEGRAWIDNCPLKDASPFYSTLIDELLSPFPKSAQDNR